MRHHDYIPELDGPQSYIAPGGKRILCKGGGGALLGAIAGAFLGPVGFGVSTLVGAAAGASIGSSLIDTPAAAKEQQKAQEQAAAEQTRAANEAAANTKRQADTAEKQAEQMFNRANARRPDTAAMLSSNEMAAKGGIGGTMLTGPTGVDPAALQLGKSTLLGA